MPILKVPRMASNGTIMDEFDKEQSPEDLVERFPLSTVFCAYFLWQKWKTENRKFTETPQGILSGEMFRQMAMAWVDILSKTHERREVVSEFMADVFASATLEMDGFDRDAIRDAIDGEHKKEG